MSTPAPAGRAQAARPSADPWVWTLRTPPAIPQSTVVFLPHAGGNAANYGDWAEHFPDDIALLAAQYPGRGPRYNEPHAQQVADWVDGIAPAVEATAGPLALLGHSLGAICALELARRLEERGREVSLLITSAPPPVPNPRLAEATADGHVADSLVRELLEEHGVLPPELLAEPELVELALESLRADLSLERRYDHGPVPDVPACPTVVLGGEDDTLVPREILEEWAHRFDPPAEVRVLPGAHFFLHEHRQTLAALVLERLRPHPP